jgi:hypothetical protein
VHSMIVNVFHGPGLIRPRSEKVQANLNSTWWTRRVFSASIVAFIEGKNANSATWIVGPPSGHFEPGPRYLYGLG